MDAHFDPSIYHPSFLQDANQANMDFFHFTFDNFMNAAHEYNLPDDVVESAVQRTWDFLGMTGTPVIVDNATCLYPNNPFTMADDVMGINVEELKNLGIHDEDSLSLVCTHEAGHRLTQLMGATGSLSPWDCELASDALLGFRAAIEGLNTDSIINSHVSDDCATHPGKDLRDDYVAIGKEILQEINNDGTPLTIDNFMAHLNVHLQEDGDIIHQREAAFRQDVSMARYGWHQSEINSHIHELENKIDFYKSVIRDNQAMANHKAQHGQSHSFEDSNINDARFELEKAIKELNSWRNEKPDDK
jgi:hypothetical protein